MTLSSRIFRYAVRSLIFIIGIVVVVSSACRKRDGVNYEPITPSLQNLVIPGKLPEILLQHEKASGNGLTAFHHFQIGKGLYQSRLFGIQGNVGDFPFFEIAELGLDIYFESRNETEHAKTQAELENMNGQLTSINAELASLNASLSALAAEMSLDFTKLENFELALNAQKYFDNIGDLYSSTSNSGLLYYSQTALDIKMGLAGPSWSILESFWQQYFSVAAGNNTSGAVASVTGLHGLVCPNSSLLQDGLLAKFAEQVIIQSYGSAHQSQHASTALGILENYFSTIINYQYQALTVYGNIVNAQDTTGFTFREYLYGTFRHQIEDEINAYLNTVDFMVLNLADFRNKVQFASDMQYYQLAMAPDTTYLNGLARSRFIAALLLQSVGLNYSIVNGTVITPNDLTNGKTVPVNTISGSIDASAVSFTANADKYPSIYPYTKWNDSLAMADNEWNFYRIQDTAQAFTGGDHTIQIFSSDAYHPWRHDLPIQGVVKVLYYNPDQPDPATATLSPTDVNSMAFGFASWAWYWGFMRLSMYDFTERAVLPFLFNFHQGGPPIGLPNNIYGFTWTDPGQYIAFPPPPLQHAPPPSFNPPPFLNNITYRGNVQYATGTEGSVNISLAYGVNYVLAPAPSGGSNVSMTFFTDVRALGKQMQVFPVNFEIYSRRFDLNNVNDQWSTIYDYNNKPEFMNGFQETEMSSVTLAANNGYTEFNFMEVYNTNTGKNWGPAFMDFEYQWCTQYCYSFTYPYSEIFGQ